MNQYKFGTLRVFVAGIFMCICQSTAQSMGVAIPIVDDDSKTLAGAPPSLDFLLCERDRVPLFISASNLKVTQQGKADSTAIAVGVRSLIYYGSFENSSIKEMALLTNELIPMHDRSEPLLISDGKLRRIKIFLGGFESSLGKKLRDGNCICGIALPVVRLDQRGRFVEREPLLSVKFVVQMKDAKISGLQSVETMEIETMGAVALKAESRAAGEWLHDAVRGTRYLGPRWIHAEAEKNPAWYRTAVSDWRLSLTKARRVSPAK